MNPKKDLIKVEGRIILINQKEGTLLSVGEDFRLDDDNWCNLLKDYISALRAEAKDDDVIVLDLTLIDDVKKISITGVNTLVGLSREHTMWYIFNKSIIPKVRNLIRPSLLKVSTDKDEARRMCFASA